MTYLKLKHSLLSIYFFLVLYPLSAQYQLNGTALAIGDDCFQLTTTEIKEIGSIWSMSKIDLRESFDITFDIYFECDGICEADGITFSLYPFPDGLGESGGGLGYETLSPSLAAEFDIFHNIGIPLGDLSDPPFDHVAIFSNGIVNHADPNILAEAVQLNPDNPNIKDCNYHEIRITWDAFKNQMAIYFECQLKMTYTGDIIEQIFQGDPMVHWGFTSSTGIQFCEQLVCVKEVKIIKGLEDFAMCKGGSIQLNATGGESYEWSPSESLNNPTIANPLASPEENTSYQVTITDGCSQIVNNVTITVVEEEVSFGFSDSYLCQGDSVSLDATTANAIYEWSTGATSPTITVLSPGYYVVTVTLDDDCVANDAVQLDFIKLPTGLFSKYTSICEGETIVLDANFPNASYLWQDGSTDSIYIVTKPGSYSVVIDHPCESKEISAEIDFELSCTDVYLPNAFSPNGDGVNDHFIILDGGDVVNIEQLRILDRWGEIVFEANNFPPNDRTFGWDGSFKGKPLNNGVYTYFVKINFRNYSTTVISGTVSIIR